MGVFDYTSGKIKLIAKIYFWAAAIFYTFLGFVGFIVSIVNEAAILMLVFLFMIPIGIFITFVSALMIYGFGRIVDNTDEIRYDVEKIREKNDFSL